MFRCFNLAHTMTNETIHYQLFRSIILYNDCSETCQLKLDNTTDNKGARSSTVLLVNSQESSNIARGRHVRSYHCYQCAMVMIYTSRQLCQPGRPTNAHIRYWSKWFKCLFALLGLNIFTCMLMIVISMFVVRLNQVIMIENPISFVNRICRSYCIRLMKAACGASHKYFQQLIS